MSEQLAEQLILFMVSALANTLAAMTGGGGGFILLPVLITLGLPFMVAVGTHKCSMLLIGSRVLLHRSVLSPLIREPCIIMGCAGVPGVIIGTYTVSLIPAAAAEISLGILSLLIAVYAILSRRMSSETPAGAAAPATRITGGVLIFITAMLAGAFSAGTGLFLAMILVVCFRMTLKQAITHSVIFASMVWNLAGAVTVAAVASIQWQWLPALLLGSVAGGMAGSWVLTKLPSRAVTWLFAAVALFSGLLMLLRHF